jgi:hypothetical protein
MIAFRSHYRRWEEGQRPPYWYARRAIRKEEESALRSRRGRNRGGLQRTARARGRGTRSCPARRGSLRRWQWRSSTSWPTNFYDPRRVCTTHTTDGDRRRRPSVEPEGQTHSHRSRCDSLEMKAPSNRPAEWAVRELDTLWHHHCSVAWPFRARNDTFSVFACVYRLRVVCQNVRPPKENPRVPEDTPRYVSA